MISDVTPGRWYVLQLHTLSVCDTNSFIYIIITITIVLNTMILEFSFLFLSNFSHTTSISIQFMTFSFHTMSFNYMACRVCYVTCCYPVLHPLTGRPWKPYTKQLWPKNPYSQIKNSGTFIVEFNWLF